MGMKEAEPLDSDRVEALTFELLKAIKANYERGPVSRDRCLEALNALGFCAAHIIHGCDDDPAALDFFIKAFQMSLHQ
jgi:hypothetical protein